MCECLEKAIESFLKDNEIQYGGLDIQPDEINFKWIDGNVSYLAISVFEDTFKCSLSEFGWDEADLDDVIFVRNR